MAQRPTPSIRPEEIAALKAEIEARLQEDPVNLDRVLETIDRIAWSGGTGTHARLMLLLFNIPLEDDEARRQWDAILAHRTVMEKAIGRTVPLRVAALDHLIQVNRRTSRPRMLEVIAAHRMDDQVLIDPVTGLHTGGFLEDQLPREVGRARRYELDLSIVHLEIDDYASIVERLGPTMGTMLLQEVAGLVRACVRTMDYAARPAASEFRLLLTETNRMGAFQVAERIRQRAESFYLQRRVGGRPFEVTLSAGVASFPQDADDAADLTRRARDAFHVAQARGRNRVAIHYRERREFMRLDLGNEDLQVAFVPEGEARQAPASMKNISSGGVLFDSATPLELGHTVQVICASRKDGEKVLIPGKVVRVESFDAEGGTRYEIGVLFDLVVEEQLEGVVDFLERFIAGTDEEPPG
ncbi:MAG: diguanylate cyclase [Candidatus Polarisedimenticolia bacterium]